MTTFTVTFEQDLYNALTPLEAAKLVREDIINGESLCFTVINESTKEEFSVDLAEEDDEAVVLISAKNSTVKIHEKYVLTKELNGDSINNPVDEDFQIGTTLFVNDIDLESSTVIANDIDYEMQKFAFNLQEFKNAIK